MLSACSLDSIWMRFRGLVKHTHELATRFCYIDYDRELAIVAEIEEEGKRKLAGVGRLVADPDHTDAEYAVLVADPWQGKGLSDALTTTASRSHASGAWASSTPRPRRRTDACSLCCEATASR